VEVISKSILLRLLQNCLKGNILKIEPIHHSLEYLLYLCEFKPVADIFFNSSYFYSDNIMGRKFHQTSIIGNILGISAFDEDDPFIYKKIYTNLY